MRIVGGTGGGLEQTGRGTDAATDPGTLAFNAGRRVGLSTRMSDASVTTIRNIEDNGSTTAAVIAAGIAATTAAAKRGLVRRGLLGLHTRRTGLAGRLRHGRDNGRRIGAAATTETDGTAAGGLLTHVARGSRGADGG